MNEMVSGNEVILLSPHLDDAVYSAWHAVRRGALVITVCTGLPGAGVITTSDRIAGSQDSRELMRQRLDEDADALKDAGASSVRLGYLDQQYRKEPLPSDELLAAIKCQLPSSSRLVYAPAALGGHPDHVAVRDVAFHLAAGTGMVLRLYADLPYAVHYGWPTWVNATPPEPFLNPDADWAQWLGSLNGQLGEPVVLELGEYANEKLAAMQKYPSQWPSLNNGSIGRLESPAVYSYEVYWPADPIS